MKVHPVDALLELAKRFNLGELDGAMLERWRVLLNTPDAAQAVKDARAEVVSVAFKRAPIAPPLSLMRHGLRFAVARSVCPYQHGGDDLGYMGDQIPRPAHVLALELGLKWKPNAGIATISLTCSLCRRVSERRVPLEWTDTPELEP